MSKKDVEDAVVRFTTAKKPARKVTQPTYIDGVKVNKVVTEDQPVEFYYGENGELTQSRDDAFCMQRKYVDGRIDHFVKYAQSGPGSGRMLNPYATYYSFGDEKKFEKSMGRPMYRLMAVNEEAYNYYMTFLKSKNERHLLHAEREGRHA